MFQFNSQYNITDGGHTTSNVRFAGRSAVGSAHPVTVSKDGQRHVRELPNGQSSEVIACGLACSEVVSGRNLAAVLKPGFDYERKVLEDLMNGVPAQPLSIHTSAGVPAPLSEFISELERHLPWKECDNEPSDWCLSLQMEGASAVLAAIDMLTQLRHIRYMDKASSVGVGETTSPSTALKTISSWKIGVGAASYHGPPSTSPGAATPLNAEKHNQLLYPVPTPFMDGAELDRYLGVFSAWLDSNAEFLSCILIEPQWGSSQCALPWDRQVLSTMVDMAHAHDVLVLSDEIMCGLGRHGHSSLFLSEAWRLDVDAVTFGKAVAAGAYPMSGAVLRRGATALGATGRTVMQSHTYSGGNVRALLTATALLKLLPSLYLDVEVKGRVLQAVMTMFQSKSEGLFKIHGLGLMWGALLNHNEYNSRSGMPPVKEFLKLFTENCNRQGVLPYFVPVGGFMVTPLFDVDISVIEQIGEKLVAAFQLTMEQIGSLRLFVSYFGNTIPVDVAPSVLVASIKKMFRVKVSYCLSYNGSPIKEVNEEGHCVTLADLNIERGATFAVTVY